MLESPAREGGSRQVRLIDVAAVQVRHPVGGSRVKPEGAWSALPAEHCLQTRLGASGLRDGARYIFSHRGDNRS
jgi:hypothetical protein